MGNTRQDLLDLALVAVEKAARDGGMIAPYGLAVRILKEHPTKGVSVAELQQAIVNLAIERRVGVEFGDGT